MSYKSRYSRKSHRPAHRFGRQQYRPSKPYGRKYYYPQPSSQQVFVEEPQTESESSESEYDGYAQSDSDEVYEFNLQKNNEFDYESEMDSFDTDSEYDSNPEGLEEVFIIADEDDTILDVIDMNDALQLAAVNEMEVDGRVRDVNDDLVRFYDSDSESLESESDVSSESDASSESESDSEIDIDDVLLLLDSDSESVTDLDVSDSELEAVRQDFVDELASDLDSDVFIEVDSDYTSSEEVDAGNPANYEYSESESDSDSDSDSEGITIYKHRFDLPDRFDSDNDSTDDELDYYDEDLDDGLLRANDSDDEFEIVDLSKDLKDSKDCELMELDDNTYKLNLRLPSMIREDLKVDFLKNQNELVISGKFDFTAEESDSDVDKEDYHSAEENVEASEASESSDSESSSDSSDSDSSDSESLSDNSESSSESESSDSSDSESEEEVVEDAQQLIKDFQKQEIQFEKRFQFDKIIKFNEIKATFLANGELELIIPNEGVPVSNDNTVSIAITDDVLGDDNELTPVVEFVAADEDMEE